MSKKWNKTKIGRVGVKMQADASAYDAGLAAAQIAVVNLLAAPADDAAEVAMKGNADPAELAFEALAAYNGGPFRPSGWYAEDPIIVDLEGMNVPASVPIDAGHMTDVGHSTKLDKSVKSLRASGILSSYSKDEDDEEAMAARLMVRKSQNGFPFQASIDFTATRTKIEHFRAGESVRVNGRTFDGPVYVARASNLRKIAILSSGADSTTETKIAAKPGDTTMNPFEQWMVAAGFDPKTVTEAQRKTLQASYDSEIKVKAAPEVKVPAVDPIAEMNAKAADNAARISEIMALCATAGNPEIDVAGAKVNLQAHAIKSNWTAEKVKSHTQEIQLAALQAKLVQAPFGFVASGKPEPTNEILESALCLRAGLPNVEKQFKPEVLEAADKHFKSFGLQQMFLMAASRNGLHVNPGERINSSGRLREVMRYAYDLKASSFSLPNILGNVANKMLVQGYMEEDQTWREVARIVTVNNFYQRTHMRLLDNMIYEELGPNGEIKHGSLGEETYTSQAKTYAKMFALDRTSLINDDLSAFGDLRMKLGRGAAQKFNVVFWTEFMSDASTFWTTTRTNYITGATTTLGTDGVGIGLGVKAVRQMTSPTADGTKHIGAGVIPKILLVPPELEANAEITYRNMNLGTVASSSANIYANKYRPVVAWQLSNSSYTGYSTTAWFLLGDPSIAAAVVVSFLNGQQMPTVESADADFDTLGIQFRGYHDFGVDQADYLCGIKSKGAA
jgi:hypothetical protein